MLLIGLTGGIGSGKSTVSSMLAERGAVVIDADAIVHELQAPGQPVLAAMVERFGDEILDEHGALRRKAVADLVFNDADALADLGAIVHPAVHAEIEPAWPSRREPITWWSSTCRSSWSRAAPTWRA
jgi:dephospho-CoA kinase